MKKSYTISYLLNKQPKSLRKNKDYHMLITFYNASPLLKRVHFNRKCYSLLNNTRIIPENLKYFYRTYRLPQNAFFPMFLKIKKEYINRKNFLKEKKRKYINDKILNLSPNTLRFIRYFAKYESTINKYNKFPIWNKIFYPGTKKNADIFSKYNRIDWIIMFYNYIENLKKRYNNINEKYLNKTIALYIFDLPIEKHSPEKIKKQYRKLSKKYHPDQGGNSRDFNFLQRAKNILID